MKAIGLDIEQIVNNIGSRSTESKREKGQHGGEDRAQIEGVGQDSGEKEEHVLGPLMEADGL